MHNNYFQLFSDLRKRPRQPQRFEDFRATFHVSCPGVAQILHTEPMGAGRFGQRAVRGEETGEGALDEGIDGSRSIHGLRRYHISDRQCNRAVLGWAAWLRRSGSASANASLSSILRNTDGVPIRRANAC